jgi:MFS family permease
MKEPGKAMMFALLTCMFVCNSLYMNVAALLPSFVDTNFSNEINSFQVGILMSVFPVGFLIAAPLTGMYAESIGRRNVLLIGVLVFSVATLTFGMASYSKKASVFYWISLGARFMQGAADALVGVTVPSILAVEYPDKVEVLLGYSSMAQGMGFTLGPLIGTLVYIWLDYTATFIFFTAFIFLIGCYCVILLPAEIN